MASNGITSAIQTSTMFDASAVSNASTSIKDLLHAFKDSNASTSGKWGGAIGTGTTLTYSFALAGVSKYDNTIGVYGGTTTYDEGVQTLNNAQKSMAVNAMTAWSSVANINFVSYKSNAVNNLDAVETASAAGDIRWGGTTNMSSSIAGISLSGYQYSGANIPANRHYTASQGDIWMNNSLPNGVTPMTSVSNVAQNTFMHELGHSLGLAHPQDTTRV